MIKEWIVMAEEINLTGGYHQQSKVYCLFQYKTERLLKYFDLPYTPEMVAQVFEYPLSSNIYIENPCRVEICSHMAKQAMHSYIQAVQSGEMKNFKPYPRFWLLRDKVESVYFNLCFISETGTREID